MKYVLPFVMMLLFLGILVAANFYLSKKFAWAFSIDSIKGLHLLFALLPIYMIGGLIGFSNTSSMFGSMLYILAAVITGIMLYLVLSTLLIDLIHLFATFKPVVFGTLVLGLTLTISTYGIWNATNTKMSHVTIPMDGLKEELRLIHLSDLHVGHFRGKKYMQKLVDMSIQEHPDLLVITGDLFDGRIRLNKENILPLHGLKVPVFFVDGNHDAYSGVKEIKTLLRGLGVRVLENEVVLYKNLQLVGLNHMPADDNTRSMHAASGTENIQTVLAGLDIVEEKPSILLHHSPDGMEYAQKAGIDLYLAGHTHGGQLFPINYLNDLLFKYNKGLSDYQGSKIFVSQGSGTFGPPFRIGTRSEIIQISLVPAITN